MRAGGFIFLFLAAAGESWCQKDLRDATLEQLLDTQVVSVSKKEQSLSKTAAAVFVISREDIRRSGATNIPDLLRMVPGVDVAQIDANAWAIAIRGFNNRYSNKVLVLVDGRSVYTSSFSGVFWDQLDMPLEDIERIEVIRGPGATMWGANAVNGVINIITRSSAETKGGMSSELVSSAGDAAGTLRYGAALGRTGSYRAFARYSHNADTSLPDGSSAQDDWSRIHGGFRADWQSGTRDDFMAEGSLFSNRESQTRWTWFMRVPGDSPFRQDLDSAGGDLTARWSHQFGDASDTRLQIYYQSFRRSDLGAPNVERAFDVDFQHHLKAGSRHDIVWGLDYRLSFTGASPGYATSFNPPFETERLYSGFVQDEIAVTNSLWLTVGSKLEHNIYTGFEYEPGARLAWTPTPHQTFWAAASRAIRQPSREEIAAQAEVAELPVAPYTTLATYIMGSSHFRSEVLLDYEAGYRAELTSRASLDLAAFAGSYHRLATYEPQPVVVTPQPTGVSMMLPLVFRNLGNALNYGGEVAVNWKISPRWRISPTYSLQHVDYRPDPASQDSISASLVRDTPQHMAGVRSFVNLSRRVEWDQAVYWTGRTANGDIPSRARLDTRLSWRPRESVEISLTGQNLARPTSVETDAAFCIVPTQAERRLFARVTWSF